jgi:hypothetical protein
MCSLSGCQHFPPVSLSDSFLYTMLHFMQIKAVLTSFSRKRRRRSLSRQKRSTTDSYDSYYYLARLTGGSVFSVSKSTVRNASDVIVGIGARKLQVCI